MNLEEEDFEGPSIWHYLAELGNYKLLKCAINDYPEIKDIRDNCGNTIWHCLARSGNYESLKLAIIDYPEIKDIENDDGWSIWMCLADKSEIIIQAYKDFKFDINMVPFNLRHKLTESLHHSKL